MFASVGGGAAARRLAGVFAAYLLLAVLATAPLVTDLTQSVIGSPLPPGEATPPLNIWCMAVVLHQLPRDPVHLFDGNAFYPYRDTLAFAEHLFVPALFASPVVAATGNWVLAYNLVQLLELAMAGLGMFLLARALTRDGPSAFAAGVIYAFHTWNINELVRSQITANQFFPFVLLALLRFFERPGPRRAALAGLAYALQSLSCMYWALYLPFVTAATGLVLWWRRRTPWRELVPLAASLGVALVLTALIVIPYLRSARELGFERPDPLSVPLDRYLDVLPSNLLYASLLGTAARNMNAAHFLGFGAMALGLLGAWPRRGEDERATWLRPLLLGLAAAGLVLSLGPQIIVGDRTLGPGPYLLLRRFVPGFRNVRYPERLSIVLVLGLAPLAAMGLARLRPRLGQLGTLAVCGFLFLEHLSVPQTLSPLPGGDRIPAVYRWLRDQSDVRVVAELPASRAKMERADALPMYYAAVHWKRHVQGYTSYFAPTYNFIKWRLFHFPAPESVAFLERFGVDTLVVTPGPEGLPEWTASDAAWQRVGPFPEGHQVLRLPASRGPAIPPPPDDEAAYREVERRGWQVQASRPGAALAADGDLATAWSTGEPQGQGDFYRIRLPRSVRLARVEMRLRSPFYFPMHLKLLGETGPEEWTELGFDPAAVYDRLFESLFHQPRDVRFVIDVAPTEVDAVRLRITETDPFWMPWIMSEVRLYEPRR